MSKVTLTTRMDTLESEVADMKALLMGIAAQVGVTVPEATGTAVVAVVAEEAPAKKAKRRLTRDQNHALADRNRKSLTAAAKKGREHYDARWAKIVEAELVRLGK